MMNEEILIKFLEQSCSPQELKEVDEWIQASPENRNQLFELERVWSLKNELYYAQPQHIDKAYRAFEKKHFKNHSSYYLTFLKYAAVLFLGIFVGIRSYIVFHEQEITEYVNQIEVPIGERASLRLSDGTLVWLNSGSRLEYPTHFATDNRQVRLEGEAYFEVQRDESLPFIVQTNTVDVKVLGTKFNVSSYAKEETKVTLKEGKVQVDCDAGKESYILHPNEQIVYSEGKGAELLQVDANRISSWTTGDLSFVNEPLEHIVKVLERRFNVQIVIEDPELSSEVFTCHSEDSAGIDQILKLLQQTRMLKYQRNKNQIIISNY